MNQIKHILLAVYFLISWKEFGCDPNCYSGSLTIPTRGSTTLNYQMDSSPAIGYMQSGSCTIKVVEKEERFDDEKALKEFVKSLNLGPLKEEMLDQPEHLKWGFKQKKVVVTEKEL
jgi:hypothetical protein